MANTPRYVFEIFRSAVTQRYNWHLKTMDGKSVGPLGDEYTEKEKCLEDIQLVRAFAPAAPVYDCSEGGKAKLVDMVEFTRKQLARHPVHTAERHLSIP